MSNLSNSAAYEQALATKQVVVRKWWKNENSSKNQVSVQFQQIVPRVSQDGEVDSLLADAQGISTESRPTAIFSLAEEVAMRVLGAVEGNCYEEGKKIILGKTIFPNTKTLGIQVVQSFERNENRPNQEPVVNPITGEVKIILGREVYQHEQLVAGVGSFTPMTEELAKELLNIMEE